MTDPRNIEHLRLALVALWPDRPVVYFNETSGQALGPGPVLTDDEREQLTRVAQAIGAGEKRGGEAALAPLHALFAGDPDTPCRTTWRDAPIEERDEGIPPAECVEVPLDELRAAFDEAERAVEGRA